MDHNNDDPNLVHSIPLIKLPGFLFGCLLACLFVCRHDVMKYMALDSWTRAAHCLLSKSRWAGRRRRRGLSHGCALCQPRPGPLSSPLLSAPSLESSSLLEFFASDPLGDDVSWPARTSDGPANFTFE